MAREGFLRGVSSGSAGAAIVLGFLYTVAAPTHHYRARIPFLIASGGLGPVAFTFLVLLAAAALGVWVGGRASMQGLAGAALVSLFATILVATGAAERFVPSFPEGQFRWAVFSAVVLVAALLLFRQRRLRTMRRGTA